MSHTLMSLDAEWRRLTLTSRARQALKQWSSALPALRGLADLDELLEQPRDDQAVPAILRALAVLFSADDLAANVLLDVRKRYRAHRLIWAPRSLDTEEIAAVAGLSLVGAIVALGLPGRQVAGAVPVGANLVASRSDPAPAA